MGMHYHPWRHLRRLVDWTLHWSDLPEGILGLTDFERRTITLTTGLTQVERRSTIAHELVHAERGPVLDVYWPREEATVNRLVARRLLPDIRQVGEALAWACDLDEAADELWVDVATLTTRLEALHPAERHYLRRRLAEA